MLFLVLTLGSGLDRLGAYAEAATKTLDRTVADTLRDHMKTRGLDFDACQIDRLETQVVAGMNYRVRLACPGGRSV